jgi:hypothetical protein
MENKRKKFRYYGFFWRGKDKKGISTWEGTFDMPPVWRILLSAVLFIVFVVGPATALSLRMPSAPYILPAVAFLYMGITAWANDMRAKILGLTSLGDVAQHSGVSEEKLQQLADEKGIKPRYKVNGRYLYDPIPFAEKELLLRHSKAPEQDELLLHPASATPSENPTLLRPVTADSPEITLSNPLIPDVESLQQNTNAQND